MPKAGWLAGFKKTLERMLKGGVPSVDTEQVSISDFYNVETKTSEPSSPDSGAIYRSDGGWGAGEGFNRWDGSSWNLIGRGGEAIRNVTTQTSSYTASAGDGVLADAGGGAITITLPTPSEDIKVSVKKIDSSTNTVMIETEGTETIDGQSSKTIDTQYEALSFISDGSDWYVF